jgi:hypothetical protein
MSILINFKTYKATWTLQWQAQGKIGWHDTQIGPPNHASTLLNLNLFFIPKCMTPKKVGHSPQLCSWDLNNSKTKHLKSY